jgi:hypothetical protein
VFVSLGVVCLVLFELGGLLMPSPPLAPVFGSSTRHVVAAAPPLPVVTSVPCTTTPLPPPSLCRDLSHSTFSSTAALLRTGVYLVLEPYLTGISYFILKLVPSSQTPSYFKATLTRSHFNMIKETILAKFSPNPPPKPFLFSTVIQDAHMEGFCLALGPGSHAFHVDSVYPLERIVYDAGGLRVKMYSSEFRTISTRSRSRPQETDIYFVRLEETEGSVFSQSTA